MGAPSGCDVSASMILGRVSRQATSRTLPAIFALTMALLAIFAPMPTAAAATAQTALGTQTAVEVSTATLTVSLTSITPDVAVPKAQILISASVRNSSGGTLTSPMARALIGQSPLNSRQAVSDWATLPVNQPLDEVAQKSLGQTLAQGALAVFTLTVPADAVSHSRPFAIIPLSIEVTGTTSASTQASGQVKTYLPPLSAVKAFVPLCLAWP